MLSQHANTPPSGSRGVPLTDYELEISKALNNYWDGENFDKSFNFKYTDGKRMEVDELKNYTEELKKAYEFDHQHDYT